MKYPLYYNSENFSLENGGCSLNGDCLPCFFLFFYHDISQYYCIPSVFLMTSLNIMDIFIDNDWEDASDVSMMSSWKHSL